jgi:hypothetical protein
MRQPGERGHRALLLLLNHCAHTPQPRAASLTRCCSLLHGAQHSIGTVLRRLRRAARDGRDASCAPRTLPTCSHTATPCISTHLQGGAQAGHVAQGRAKHGVSCDSGVARGHELLEGGSHGGGLGL